MISAVAPSASEFSLGAARGQIKDLFQPNPAIYWADFLGSLCLGVAAFWTVRRWGLFVGQPWAVVLAPLSFAVSVLAIYRAANFTHELVHLRGESFRPFRIAWNVLCGIPFLMPSFTYYTHVRHHTRRLYGTLEDGEYLSLAEGPPRRILAYLCQPLVLPLLAVVRFGLLAPVSWVSPPVRQWAYRHASSMVIDPAFIRPLPTRQELGIWRLQEAATFAYVLAAGLLLALGRVPLAFLPQAYATGVGVLLLNHVRTLGAHRYRHRREEVSFLEQLLDTVNYPSRLWTAELWAPVGLRYHALHHLFPSLPYHNLGKAHRRLMSRLPADSPYRKTECPNLPTALAQLWAEASRGAGRAISEPASTTEAAGGTRTEAWPSRGLRSPPTAPVSR
jgi:fatty acid desaturase